MVLIREVEEAAWDIAALGSGEGFHTLANGDTEIFFVVDDKDRGIPVLYKVVGGESRPTPICNRRANSIVICNHNK